MTRLFGMADVVAQNKRIDKIAILESFIDDGVILCCREIQKVNR